MDRNNAHCRTCDRDLEPGAILFRLRMEPGGPLASLCEEHIPKDYGVERVDSIWYGDCIGCERPMGVEPGSGAVYCSLSCRWTAASDRAMERRQAANAARLCIACEQPVGATRSDALYCCNACRQFAYRVRQRAA